MAVEATTKGEDWSGIFLVSNNLTARARKGI